MSEVQFTEEDERLLVKGIKYNQPARLTQKKLEELTISCEQVIRTMKYDERPEARTKIGKVLLDIEGDLNHTEARHSIS